MIIGRRLPQAALVVVMLTAGLVAGPVAASSEVRAYDLGDTTILQPQHSDASGLRTMPVALRGIIAMPDGDGPFPVAVIVHGSYAFCTAPLIGGEVDPYPCPSEHDLRQHEGFGYLADVLARAGYVALVPDLAAEFNNGFGEPVPGDRALQLLDAHLDALATGSAFGAPVTDRADLDRLVLAGHSRGGPIAIRYASDERWASHDPSALALLAPAAAPAGLRIAPTLAAALVAGTCDGDVGFEAATGYLDDQLAPSRPAITLTMVIHGGTHNGFSTRLGPDPVVVCAAGQVIAGTEQRDRIAAALPSFFDLALAEQAAR